jgi:hypothetical protein
MHDVDCEQGKFQWFADRVNFSPTDDCRDDVVAPSTVPAGSATLIWPPAKSAIPPQHNCGWTGSVIIFPQSSAAGFLPF